MRVLQKLVCFSIGEAKPRCYSLCLRVYDDVERCWIYSIRCVCHANEQLPLCYAFLINVLWGIAPSFSQSLMSIICMFQIAHHYVYHLHVSNCSSPNNSLHTKRET